MTVYVLCPDAIRPAGGVQKLYDHVDILNRHGISATIVHHKAPYRAGWFNNQTALAYTPVDVKRGDLIAIPEVFGDALMSLAPGAPRVSVNQNAYNSFRRIADPSRHPYTVSPDLLGVMVISENNYALVSGMFPSVDVRRVHAGVDSTVFYSSDCARGRVLSYMPRKRSDEIDAVLLLARSSLEGWQMVRIDGLSQGEVADTLRRSALFLSFSEREGIALPPLEALACGCYVIGFDGFGAREYFDPRFTTRVDDGDVVAFAATLSEWVRSYEWTPEVGRRAAAASSFVLERYSLERESDDVIAFYTHFLELAEMNWNSSRDSIKLNVPSLQIPRWRKAGSHLVAALSSLTSR